MVGIEIDKLTQEYKDLRIYSSYFSPNIPNKKIVNFQKKFGKIDTNENRIFFYDHTTFGSGKEGILITEKNVYSRYVGVNRTNPFVINNEDSDKIMVEAIAIKETLGYKIHASYQDGTSTEICSIAGPSKEEILQIIGFITSLCKIINGNHPEFRFVSTDKPPENGTPEEIIKWSFNKLREMYDDDTIDFLYSFATHEDEEWRELAAIAIDVALGQLTVHSLFRYLNHEEEVFRTTIPLFIQHIALYPMSQHSKYGNEWLMDCAEKNNMAHFVLAILGNHIRNINSANQGKEHVREFAKFCLIEFDDSTKNNKLSEEMINSLNSPDEEIIILAVHLIEILSDITAGDTRLIDPILNIINKNYKSDEDFIHETAFSILSKIGGDKVVEILSNIIADPNSKFNKIARDTISEMKSPNE